MSSQDELEYKRELVSQLRARHWHVQEHEDKYALFIPDLSIARNRVEPWIEVKYRRELPPTLHSMKHWTAGQQEWLEKRGRAGSGYCFMLLGVPGHHYLWRWQILSTVRRMSIDSAVEYCDLRTVGSVDRFVCDLWNLCGRDPVPGARQRR